jgi:hypothetical protein
MLEWVMMTVVVGGILRFSMVLEIMLCFVALGFRFSVILSKLFLELFLFFFFLLLCVLKFDVIILLLTNWEVEFGVSTRIEFSRWELVIEIARIGRIRRKENEKLGKLNHGIILFAC